MLEGLVSNLAGEATGGLLEGLIPGAGLLGGLIGGTMGLFGGGSSNRNSNSNANWNSNTNNNTNTNTANASATASANFNPVNSFNTYNPNTNPGLILQGYAGLNPYPAPGAPALSATATPNLTTNSYSSPIIPGVMSPAIPFAPSAPALSGMSAPAAAQTPPSLPMPQIVQQAAGAPVGAGPGDFSIPNPLQGTPFASGSAPSSGGGTVPGYGIGALQQPANGFAGAAPLPTQVPPGLEEALSGGAPMGGIQAAQAAGLPLVAQMPFKRGDLLKSRQGAVYPPPPAPSIITPADLGRYAAIASDMPGLAEPTEAAIRDLKKAEQYEKKAAVNTAAVQPLVNSPADFQKAYEGIVNNYASDADRIFKENDSKYAGDIAAAQDSVFDTQRRLHENEAEVRELGGHTTDPLPGATLEQRMGIARHRAFANLNNDPYWNSDPNFVRMNNVQRSLMKHGNMSPYWDQYREATKAEYALVSPTKLPPEEQFKLNALKEEGKDLRSELSNARIALNQLRTARREDDKESLKTYHDSVQAKLAGLAGAFGAMKPELLYGPEGLMTKAQINLQNLKQAAEDSRFAAQLRETARFHTAQMGHMVNAETLYPSQVRRNDAAAKYYQDMLGENAGAPANGLMEFNPQQGETGRMYATRLSKMGLTEEAATAQAKKYFDSATAVYSR